MAKKAKKVEVKEIKDENNQEKIELSAALKHLIEANDISIETLEFGEGENKVEIKVNPVVTAERYISVVSTIAEYSFIGERDTIDCYAPAYTEYARRIALLANFTDLKIPTNVEDSWALVFYTPIYEQVCELIDGVILSSMFNEAKKLINAKLQYLVNKTDVNKLFSAITKAVENINFQFSQEDIERLMGLLQGITNVDQESILNKIIGTTTK